MNQETRIERHGVQAAREHRVRLLTIGRIHKMHNHCSQIKLLVVFYKCDIIFTFISGTTIYVYVNEVERKLNMKGFPLFPEATVNMRDEDLT